MSHVQVSDLHPNLHKGHTMCASMVDNQSATAEIRQGRKKKKQYYQDMWRRYCCLTSFFFPIVDTFFSCEDIARQSCGMVPRWRIFGDFLARAFPASRGQHISDLHSKFALGPHHVWKYGRHPICGRCVQSSNWTSDLFSTYSYIFNVN